MTFTKYINIFVQLLILSIVIFQCSCDNSTEPKTVHGCLDSQACNYNPSATIDNNSCEYLDNCDVCDNDPSNDCGQDCADVWGGTATLDDCGVCNDDSTDDCTQDCFGEWGGEAFLDDCNICSGGTTGYEPGSDIDLCGICFGNNFSLVNEPFEDVGGDGAYQQGESAFSIFGTWIYFDNGLDGLDPASPDYPGPDEGEGDRIWQPGDGWVDDNGNGLVDEGGIDSYLIPDPEDYTDIWPPLNGIWDDHEVFEDLNNNGMYDNLGPDVDCSGVCFGSSFVNDCGCVGGESGHEPEFCYGCTDSNALNYDPNATIDDGSCEN